MKFKPCLQQTSTHINVDTRQFEFIEDIQQNVLVRPGWLCRTEKWKGWKVEKSSCFGYMVWCLLKNRWLLQQENPGASSHFQLSQVKNEELSLQSDSMTETWELTQPADMTRFHGSLSRSVHTPTYARTHSRYTCTNSYTYECLRTRVRAGANDEHAHAHAQTHNKKQTYMDILH